MIRTKKNIRLIYGEGDKPPEPKPPEPKGLSQAEVDEVIKKRLGEQQKKFDAERTANLEKMSKLETDAAAKAELEKQIEELNNRYKSKDELAMDALKKERTEREAKQKAIESERDTWKKKFEDQTLLVDLTGAATKKPKGADGKDIEITNPNQFVKFLRPAARLVEKVVDGKPTGEFETRIKVQVKGKELDLTPDEAVKATSEDPEYGHWFRAGIVGGLGAKGGNQGAGGDGLLSMSQEQFTKRFLEGTLPKRR